jgi:hypothetical protein
MACNLEWPKIRRLLTHVQTPQDRLDLIARVLNLKLERLIADIVRKQVFGPVLDTVYTIEFQKRGLPHAHIPIIVNPVFRPRNADDVDAIVSAEIPDRNTDPKL